MNDIEITHKLKNFDIACSYMERVFYTLFHPQKPSTLPRERGWHPFTNVYECASEILIEAELAGLDKEEIQISFKDHYLIIKGVRKERVGKANILYHQMEVEYGPFERIIYVPFEVDEKGIQGRYEDGFLTVKLPKDNKNS